MKKGLCLLLCAVVMGLTFCSCGLKDKNAIEDITYVDEQGKTQVYATDKKGNVVTDKNGSYVSTTTTQKTDKNGKVPSKSSSGQSFSVYVTDADGEYVTDKNGKLVTSAVVVDANALAQGFLGGYGNTTTTTTKKGGNKNNDKTNSSTTTTTKNLDQIPLSPKEDLLDDGKKTDNTSLLKTVIKPIVSSGTFTIKGSIKASNTLIPITVAYRNGKDISISVSYNMGIMVEMRMFTNNGKAYMALPGFAVYGEISEDELSGYEDLTGAFSNDDAKYVKTTKVKDGVQTLTCEEYKSGDGIVKYYFNSKNEWKRMEIIDSDKAVIWNITSFSNTAKDSLFAINKLWRKEDKFSQIKAVG